jgi:hypothetical protein
MYEPGEVVLSAGTAPRTTAAYPGAGSIDGRQGHGMGHAHERGIQTGLGWNAAPRVERSSPSARSMMGGAYWGRHIRLGPASNPWTRHIQ